MVLYDRQLEILDSVVRNTETFVHAGHKVGKDRIAALTALWFFCTRQPARVIISSSSQTQLKDTLWTEISWLVRNASRPLGVILKSMLCNKPLPGGRRDEELPLDYIHAIVARHGESFSGHHLESGETPRVLVILSEASAIDDEFYDSAQTQAQRILVTGNPLRTRGFFARAIRAGSKAHPSGDGKLLRRVIHIDAEKTPNVLVGKECVARGVRVEAVPRIVPGILSYQEYLERLEWEPIKRRVRLHGLLPDDEGDSLFPAGTLDFAQRLGEVIQNAMAAGVKVRWGKLGLGVDGGEGGDDTVWSVVGRYGQRFSVAKKTPNTVEVLGVTLRLLKKFPDIACIAFDSAAGGKQYADEMRNRGYENVLDVFFGAKADRGENQYSNMRCQIYGELARAMKPTRATRLMAGESCEPVPVEKWHKKWRCFAFSPTNSRLREDLAVLPKLYDGHGRMRLPPKKHQGRKQSHSTEQSIYDMLGRSPDDGDACALGYYAWRWYRALQATVHNGAKLVY